ncbi:hypothetical protein BDR06DRAFT_889842 [Suillus hirtellus]|nr:hypothetical protein BDR06DRAFT_889842 [Suillus hirtellus]
MIVARSFAQIHETNLKKQEVLPLWFIDKNDYSHIRSGDIVQTISLEDLIKERQNTEVKLKVTKHTGKVFEILTKHTMSEDQLKWFCIGSALNFICSQLS